MLSLSMLPCKYFAHFWPLDLVQPYRVAVLHISLAVISRALFYSFWIYIQQQIKFPTWLRPSEMGFVEPPPLDNTVREFLNYSICLNLFRDLWVPTVRRNSSVHACFTGQTFFEPQELSLSSLPQSCAIWRQDCAHWRVKASFEFELIHMLIYFKYPCITTSVFLAAQFVVPVASYFWWRNKIGQNIVLRFILASNFKKGKIPPCPRIFLIWMVYTCPLQSANYCKQCDGPEVLVLRTFLLSLGLGIVLQWSPVLIWRLHDKTLLK